MTTTVKVYKEARIKQKQFTKTAFFWFSAVGILTSYIVKGILVKYKVGNFETIDFIAFGVLVFLFLVIFSFVYKYVDTNERKYFSKYVNDSDFRRKIISNHCFIEGNWFIATIFNNKVLEYAIATISFDEISGLSLSGELFIINGCNPNEKCLDIGSFNSLVGKYYQEHNEYVYGYERESTYENESINLLYKESGKSKGVGIYRFAKPLTDNNITQLTGSYDDPIQDKTYKLIGYSISEVFIKNLDIRKNADISSTENKIKCHRAFLKKRTEFICN